MITDITRRDTITAIINRYEAAMAAASRLNAVYQESHAVFKAVDGYGYFMRFDCNADYDAAAKRLTECTWMDIIRKTGIMDAVTTQRRDEITRSVEAGNMPPLTVDNALDICCQLYRKAPDMMTEFIKDCYDMFIPNGNFSKLKTSRDGEIRNRGIIQYVFDVRFGFSLSYYGRGVKKLKTLENTFSLLDGKGVVSDGKENLESKIRSAISTDKKTLETDYFKLKWYKNENLHVEFKRMDLVAKINAIGAGARLK